MKSLVTQSLYWLLTFQLAFAPSFALANKDPQQSSRFQWMLQQLQPKNWFSGSGTHHQRLGINTSDYLGSRSALRQAEIQMSRQLPHGLGERFSVTSSNELRQLSPQELKSLQQQNRAALENLTRAIETKLQPKLVQQYIEANLNSRLNSAEWAQAAKSDPVATRAQVRMILEIEYLQEKIQSLRAAAGSSALFGNALQNAQESWRSAARTLSNPLTSNMIRISENIFQRATVISQKNAEIIKAGAATSQHIGRFAMSNQNIADFVRELQTGQVQITRMTAIIMGFLFVSSVYKMVTAYEANPNVGEELVATMLKPAIYLSGMTFYMGANAAHYGALESLRLTALSLDALMKQKNSLFANNYKAYRAQFKLHMSAMSYMGIVGGFLAVPTMFKYVDKLWQCHRLIDDRPLEEQRLSTMKKQQLSVLCEKGLRDFVAETAKDPQVQNGIAGFFAAKTLLKLAEPGKSLAALHKKASGAIGTAAARSTHFVLRGASKPLIRIGSKLGGGATVIFLTVASLATQGFTWARNQVSVKRPIRQHKRKFEELAAEWRANNWDASNICRTHMFFDGWFVGGWKTLTSTFRSEVDGQICGDELIGRFIESYNSVLTSWRESLLGPTTQAIQQWIHHTSQALNTFQSAKMFYRDVITQIQVQRSGNFQLPRRTLEDGRVSDTIGDLSMALQPLPLFRSTPFFGWEVDARAALIQNANTEQFEQIKSEVIAQTKYEFFDDAGERKMDWENWSTSPENATYLKQNWEIYQKRLLPSVQIVLEKIQQKNPQSQTLKKVSQLLAKGDDVSVVDGLYYISYYSEVERRGKFCQRQIDLTSSDSNKFFQQCPFTVLQAQFYDDILYSWNDELERYTFNGKESNQAMGANSNMGVIPFGVKPLSAGQAYLLNYTERFTRYGIDPDFYNPYEDGLYAETMAEYYLKQMLCGVEPNVELRNLQRAQWATNARLKSPTFRPPALPLRKDLDLCPGTIAYLTDKASPKFAHVIAKTGWKTADDFYHSITDKRGPSYGTYAGIVDLLYNEIDLEQMQDFDTWWNTHIAPQFEIVLQQKYEEFQNSVLQDQLLTALTFKSNDYWSVKKGYFQSSNDQLNKYFTEYLDPMAQELPLNLEHSEGSLSDAQARDLFLENYQNNRNDLLELFQLMQFERREVSSINLQQQIAEKLMSYKNKTDATETDETFFDQNQVKMLVIAELIIQKSYNLRVLFGATVDGDFDAVFTAIRDRIEADTNLTEEQKQTQLDDVLEKEINYEDAVKKQLQSVGSIVAQQPERVLFEDASRPLTINAMLVQIDLMMQSTFELLNIQYQYQPLDRLNDSY